MFLLLFFLKNDDICYLVDVVVFVVANPSLSSISSFVAPNSIQMRAMPLDRGKLTRGTKKCCLYVGSLVVIFAVGAIVVVVVVVVVSFCVLVTYAGTQSCANKERGSSTLSFCVACAKIGLFNIRHVLVKAIP